MNAPAYQRHFPQDHRQLNDLGFDVEKMAEVTEVVGVVAVEEYLVEAGEGEDFLSAVELDLYGDDAPSGRRDVDVVRYGADGDQHLRFSVLFLVAGEHIDAGDPLPYFPECSGDGVSHSVVVYYVEGLGGGSEAV